MVEYQPSLQQQYRHRMKCQKELKSSKQIVIVADIFRLHQTLTLFLVGYLFAVSKRASI